MQVLGNTGGRHVRTPGSMRESGARAQGRSKWKPSLEVCPESASILLVSVCRRHLETQSIQLQPGVLTGLKAKGPFPYFPGPRKLLEKFMPELGKH